MSKPLVAVTCTVAVLAGHVGAVVTTKVKSVGGFNATTVVPTVAAK
jgi:hypothetical protein